MKQNYDSTCSYGFRNEDRRKVCLISPVDKNGNCRGCKNINLMEGVQNKVELLNALRHYPIKPQHRVELEEFISLLNTTSDFFIYNQACKSHQITQKQKCLISPVNENQQCRTCFDAEWIRNLRQKQDILIAMKHYSIKKEHQASLDELLSILGISVKQIPTKKVPSSIVAQTNTSANERKIYILRLEHGKFYIGKSKDIKRRYQEHLLGNGSDWTKLHKPLCLEYEKVEDNPFAEDIEVKKFMKIYGIENVRGGSYSTIKLDKNTKKIIMNEIRGAEDKCFGCGDDGHFMKECSVPKKQNQNPKSTDPRNGSKSSKSKNDGQDHIITKNLKNTTTVSTITNSSSGKLKKTRMCWEYENKTCVKGDACPFSHSLEECILNSKTYRSANCEDESCDKRRCDYAHGKQKTAADAIRKKLRIKCKATIPSPPATELPLALHILHQQPPPPQC